MKETYIDETVFEQDVKGFLFYMEVLFDGSEKAKLIFEYGKESLYKLREGDIVVVESFSTLTPHNGGKYYTLLTITRIEPTHITIDRLKRYKFMGAIREFLKQTTADFEAEDPRLIRDHVYIGAEAVQTGYLMEISGTNVGFKNETSKPILGRDAGLLKPAIVGQLLNKGIEKGLVVGNIHSNYEEKSKIQVMVKPNKLVTHHFTIFGFTGAGKSNLSSGVLSKMIREHRINSLIFDLSDEYTALMADVLEEQGFIIIDREDLPDSLISYFSDHRGNIDELAKELAIKTKKPGIFDSKKFELVYQKVFKKLLEENRIKALDQSTGLQDLRNLDFNGLMSILQQRCQGSDASSAKFPQLSLVIRDAIHQDTTLQKDEFDNFPITQDILDHLLGIFDNCHRQLSYNVTTGQFMTGIVREVNALFVEIRAGLRMQGTRRVGENFVDSNWILDTFVRRQEEKKKLAIIVSSDKETLAGLIAEIINRSLGIRRKEGTKSHDMLFVVDEGHEFVPNPRETGISDSEKTCSRIIERLTRMGRKYGLGVCIASQRTAHVNTTALSNCHTTFLGALPRKYDRDTMNEAYAISPEVLNRVVTFPSGNWYVASNGAMGINNVPIWINSANREKELAEFFKKQQYLDGESEKHLKENNLL